MGLFGPKSGSWYFNSKIDPRWNVSGHVSSLSVFTRPPEAEQALERLKKEHGEPPEDLSYGCMKD